MLSTLCALPPRRYIVKQLSKSERQSFLEFAPDYFRYLAAAEARGRHTCLARVLGVFQVGSCGRVGRRVGRAGRYGWTGGHGPTSRNGRHVQLRGLAAALQVGGASHCLACALYPPGPRPSHLPTHAHAYPLKKRITHPGLSQVSVKYANAAFGMQLPVGGGGGGGGAAGGAKDGLVDLAISENLFYGRTISRWVGAGPECTPL